MMTEHLRHGVFLAPFHALAESPTLALRRDLDLMRLLDELGYEEAWIGEHHSAGFETISSPEVFIAAAAEHTKRIRFGTGVVSLPYHQPLMVANRIVQLDHMTMGRVMFGAGPGLLASDALMLGIDPSVQRDRMAEGIDVILRLLRGECVTEETDWYTLRDARLHLLPYTRPHPEVVVASAVTPSGGRLAGRYDLGMLSVAASQTAGFDALDTNWRVATEVAAEHGREMDRAVLRVVAPLHIAATREQAMDDVGYGLQAFVDYFNNNMPRFHIPEGTDPAEWAVDTGYAAIGTPDDAIALIQRLFDKQGGFGCFLLLAHNWADWEATKRSYELYARHVMPYFRGTNTARVDSYRWVSEHRDELSSKRTQAAREMFEKHEAEQRAKRGEAGGARPRPGAEAW